MNEELLKFKGWDPFRSIFSMFRTYEYLDVMDADEVIRNNFSKVYEFSNKLLKLEYESRLTGYHLNFKSNYELIFRDIDEHEIVSIILWLNSSHLQIGFKNELINEDWSQAIGHLYLAVKNDRTDLPQYLADNEMLLQGIMSSAEKEYDLQSDLYGLEKGINLLNDHDVGVIAMRHEILIMGLGREPRVPTLESYCNLIGLISGHNQTENLKKLLLEPLSSAEKDRFRDWVIKEDVLSYIDEHYTGLEFLSLEL